MQVAVLTGRAIAVVTPLAISLLVLAGPAAGGQPPMPAERCRIDGRLTSGGTPLPGVTIGVKNDNDDSRMLTSTDLDGRYSLAFSPHGTYRIVTDFRGFAPVERTVSLGDAPCDSSVDIQLTLARTETKALPAPAAEGAAPLAAVHALTAGPAEHAAAPTARAAARFQRLDLQRNGREDTETDSGSALDTNEVAALLPPGFSVESARGDAIALTGATNATSVNRGLMNDRIRAIDAGELDPATGQFAAGFGGPGGGFGGPPGGAAGRGGGPGGPGGRFGGPGAFVLGGRGARGQRPYQGTVTYSFGGSALNSPPYQLRPDVPVTQPDYAQNSYGATFGGPLKIPGVYKDQHRRSTFQVNFSGNQSNNLFDQYATVPTDAMRTGDFSGMAIQLVDPASGQPFAGNQIPASSVDPTAAALLRFIPAPNLPGDTRNYHLSTTARTSSNAVSLRVSQNLSPSLADNGAGPRGRGGFAGGPGAFGRGGGGQPGNGRTNIVLNGQLQYRENTTEAVNVFPDLSGETTSRSLTVPLSLNVMRKRIIQNIGFSLTHATVETTNSFANVENVAGLAGIQYPGTAAVDPANWGVPNLSFSGFTGVRGTIASERSDDRLVANYTWIAPVGRHRVRLGGDVRYDRSASMINSNARGSFVFTGGYSANGAVSASGADFADFLLGRPQQASLEAGGTSELRQHAFDAFVEDNWQANAKLTFNVGLRYELAKPYVEVNGRMANLDANADLSQVASVLPGGVGPFTGAFPASLLNTDANNLGPRLGVAYRVTPSTILRGGYSITYNSGSYASIARELTGQPPFADTVTVSGDADAPLTIADALLTPAPAITNNWGVDRDYLLGMIQTWNATATKNLTQDWMLQAGYTGVKGTDLDILRAPALLADGGLIPGSQPFIWESSGGRSLMNAANLQLRRRLARGYSGGLSYTFAHAMDDASSLGAGGPVVAQNDKHLEAEYARSTFERRHQLSGTLYVELPWGPNRRWLKDGGALATLFGEWAAQVTVTAQSGTPLTARVLGSTSDLTRGVNGSLRANYSGDPIVLSNPTVDEFFNTTAFSLPAAGAFGTSSRNLITGPSAEQLNALFQRDIRTGGNRSVTLQVNAVNLLNTVQWATVDTNVNSPSFGQVLSVRPMRTVTLSARVRF